MRGNPAYLNTRGDYLKVKDALPEAEWKTHWQRLLQGQHIWAVVGTLVDPEAGITDSTHRVVRATDETGATVYSQEQLVEDPNCKMFRLGFTEAEVRAALEA